MEARVSPLQRKHLGRRKSFAMLSEYLEFGDLFKGHALGELI